MDKKTKNSSVETEQATPSAAPAKKGPVMTFRADDVSAAIFSHTFNERTDYSVTFTRWYRDRNGKSRYVNFFGLEDLGKVVTVAKQSDEYIRGVLNPQIER